MGAETRARLVEAARRLFLEKGYASTSMRDLLTSAGANSGSAYHFFPTKQDLLLAVLETYAAGIRPMLVEPAWRRVTDPIARIFALLGAYRRLLVESDLTYGCPIGSLALELHEADPPVRRLLSQNFDAWLAVVRECLDAAPLRADVDREALATLVLTTMEGGVMLARTYRDVAAFDRAVAELRRYITALTASTATRAKRARRR